MSQKEKVEQLYNLSEYELAYQRSVKTLTDKINQIRISINTQLDSLQHDVEGIMETAAGVKTGGVRIGKVWDLYENHPKNNSNVESVLQQLTEWQQAKFPFLERLIEILKNTQQRKDFL